MATGNIDIILTANGQQFARQISVAHGALARFSVSVGGLGKVLKAAGLYGSVIGVGVGIAAGLRKIFVEGAAGADALTKSAKAAGVTLAGIDAERIAAASKSLTSLIESFRKLGYTIASTVAPAVEKVAGALDAVLGTGLSPGGQMMELSAAGEYYTNADARSFTQRVRAAMAVKGNLLGFLSPLWDPRGRDLLEQIGTLPAVYHPLYDQVQRRLRKFGWTDEMLGALRVKDLPSWSDRAKIYQPGFNPLMLRALPNETVEQYFRDEERRRQHEAYRKAREDYIAWHNRARLWTMLNITAPLEARKLGGLFGALSGEATGMLFQSLDRAGGWLRGPKPEPEPGQPIAHQWGTTEAYNAFLAAQREGKQVEKEMLREQRMTVRLLEAIRAGLVKTVIGEIPKH